MAVGIVMMLFFDRFLQTRRSSEIETASKVFCSTSRVGLITREKVSVSDTVGSEQTNQEEMPTTGETVYECKDKTDNALLHGTPRQVSNRLFT